MRRRIDPRLALLVLPLVAAALGTAWSAGCAKSADDCAALGLPEPCADAGTTATGTGGAGGTATTSTTSGTGGTSTTSGSAGGGGATGDGGLPELATCAYKFWGDTDEQAVRALASDSNGVLFAGDFLGQLDLGLGAMGPATSRRMFVARATAQLELAWNQDFDAGLLAIAPDKLGNVYVAGTLPASASVDFGCGAPLDPLDGGGGRVFLVKLGAKGSCLAQSQHAATAQRASLAVDSKGRVIMAAGVTGPTTFGSKTFTATDEDIVVVGFDEQLGASWVHGFANAGTDEPVGVAVDATDHVYVAGTFQGSLNPGSGSGSLDSGGHTAVVVLALNAGSTTGTAPVTWAKAFASPADASVTGVVLLSSGDIAVAGTYTGSIDCGGGTAGQLQSNASAAFVTRLKPDGTFVRATSIAGLSAGDLRAMAAGSANDVALAGSVSGGLYFARVHDTTGDAGAVVDESQIPGTGADHAATGAAFTDATTVILGGYFSDTLSSAPWKSGGSDDAVLLRICNLAK